MTHNCNNNRASSPTKQIGDAHFKAGIANVKEDDAQVYAQNYGAHREGISMQEMADYYSQWAKSGAYDQDLCVGRYNGPEIAAERVDKLPGLSKETAQVIDLAAGTGRVGKLLAELSWRQIDFLDPSSGMMEVARGDGHYRNFYLEFLTGKREKEHPVKYDVVVMAGGMGEGHIPRVAIPEMVSFAKSGGFVVLVMRKEYLTYVADYNEGKVYDCFEELKKQKICYLHSEEIVPNYSFGKDGVVFILKAY